METPLHPMLVHLPLGLALILPLLAIAALVAWWREWVPPQTWWVIVALQALLTAGAFVAMETGEDEEHAVEAVVGHDAIHDHEEAGELFAWTSAGVLALAFLGGAVPHDMARRGLATAATVGTVGVLALGVWTGKKGGELVYVHGAANAYAAPASANGDAHAPKKHDDDDDDDH